MTIFRSLLIAWKLGLRQIWQHPGRAALTLASITIGVAAVVAVTIAARATDHAMEAMFQSLTGLASLEITSDGGGSIDGEIVKHVSGVTGVETLSPVLHRHSILTFKDHRIKLTTLGIEPTSYRAVHPFTITDGTSLEDAKGVLLESNLAKSIDAHPGDTVKILTRRGRLGVKVVGLFQSKETLMTSGGAGLLMTLRAAQFTSKMPNKIHSVQLVLDSHANEQDVRSEIASRLPPGIHVAAPGSQTSFAEETSLSIRHGMMSARAFLLLVATFIIANTYLINVTQRRSQFGIMRAIGATSRQVSAILCCEAFMLGTLGAILGWLGGMIGAGYVNDAMGRLYETTLPSVAAGPTSLALACLFGIGLSMLGVWLPARRAGRLPPVEAMRCTSTNETEGTSGRISVIGITMVVLGSFSLAAGIGGWLPSATAAWSGVLILSGMVLVVPTMVSPLSAQVARVMQPFMQVASRLARLQLLRHRTRTALTIGVLFIAISTGVGLASSVIDNVNDVKNWYRRSIVADYLVRAMSPDMATGQAADMPDEVGDEIRKIDHISSIETARFVRARANDRSVIVVTFDAAGSLSAFLDSMIQQRSSQSSRPVAVDEVIIGSVFAIRSGELQAGDTISLETNNGTVPLRIAGVVNDYLAGGQTVYMSRASAERLLGVGGVDTYLINADHNYLRQVRLDLEAITHKHGLLLESFSDVHESIDRRMAGVVAGLWAMVVIGCVVATLGVANTLTMNVLEQTRELGLLRIVGATQQQIRQVIFGQALMMGVIALVPGAITGLVISYLISLTTYPVTGHAVEFAMHPMLILGGMAFGFVVVIAAAWSPARRAARLPLVKTLMQK